MPSGKPYPTWLVSLKEGGNWTGLHTRKDYASTSQEIPEIARKPEVSRRERRTWNKFSSSVPRPWTSRLQNQDCIYPCCLSCRDGDSLIWQPEHNNTPSCSQPLTETSTLWFAWKLLIIFPYLLRKQRIGILLCHPVRAWRRNWVLSGVEELMWIIKKAREFQKKTSISALLTMPKPLTVWITTNWKILKDMQIPEHLTCLLRNLYAGQEATELDMEQHAGSK